MVNDTTKLLGLEGVRVIGVDVWADGVPCVALATADEAARHCPACGFLSTRAHSRVATRPRDVAVAGRRTELIWHKRRWWCLEASCPRTTFTESIPQVPPRSRLTTRLREALGADVGDRGRTVTQTGRDHGVSWPVVMGAVRRHAAGVLPQKDPEVRALGIDETRRGKPRFRYDEVLEHWQVVADTWHVGFVDLEGGAGLLGQVEGRTAASVTAWIEAHDREWRDKIAFVAIDMCQIFASAVRTALPHAKLAVDHFHVVQLANKAVSEVRRRVTVQARGRRGRKGNREWELRNRLTRSAARTPGRLLDPMVDDLAALPPKIGQPILAAWNCKEDLMDLMALMHTHPPRHEIYRRLENFYQSAADTGLPEMKALAQTVSTWRNEIITAITTGISNAASEGHNRVIKTDARNAYGYRNTDNQRLRTRLATTRRGRGCLKTTIKHA